MKTFNVGIIGATGMVGQRFALLLDKHPWFNVVAVAASPRSAGKKLKDAIGSRWAMTEPMPEEIGELTVMDAAADVEKIASMVDFVFCAVDMKKDEIRALEEKYAKAECPVVSNNSAHRGTPDVPMVVPELNPEHIEIIEAQKKRLGTKRGFIAVKSNCSLQSYVPALAMSGEVDSCGFATVLIFGLAVPSYVIVHPVSLLSKEGLMIFPMGAPSRSRRTQDVAGMASCLVLMLISPSLTHSLLSSMYPRSALITLRSSDQLNVPVEVDSNNITFALWAMAMACVVATL